MIIFLFGCSVQIVKVYTQYDLSTVFVDKDQIGNPLRVFDKEYDSRFQEFLKLFIDG